MTGQSYLTSQGRGQLRSQPGTVSAPNRPAVIAPPQTIAPQATAPGLLSRFRSPRISSQDLLLITSQLSIMTQTGVDLATALSEIVKQYPPGRVKDSVSQVLDSISAGDSISHALDKQRSAFGDSYVAVVVAGESTGKLGHVLNRLTELIQSRIRLSSMLKSVLSYPLVLCGVAGFVTSILFFFVLPQFATIFERMGTTPPLMTRILLDSSAFVRSHWYLIPGLLIAVACWIYRATQTGWLKRWFDTLLLTNRFVRGPAAALLTGRLFRLLGTLLQSGVPLLESVQLVGASQSNHLFRELFQEIEFRLNRGEKLAEPLLRATFIPQGVSQMVATAEKTGQLGTVMEKIGEFYEDHGENRLRDMVRILEPLIIVVMGVLVAFIVAAIMLPLLDISSSQ